MKQKDNYLTALVADHNGNIFELEGYAAVGMSGLECVPLTVANTKPMPYGGELMYLPERNPILYDIDRNRIDVLTENPYDPGKPVLAVASFNSPGFVNSYISAYKERAEASHLPLFSYGAVGWYHDGFRSAVILVDNEKRQDLRRMRPKAVMEGIKTKRKRMPDNRLRAHLETCARTYGCPAGKNFFLERYEAPLPTSKKCNAKCLGCISLQNNTEIPNSQNRIEFIPTPEEIAEVAIDHINRVTRPVVSFGQGCEGDPLLVAGHIEAAIRLIRSETGRGTINMNTNGSLPNTIEKLFNAGLDSIRISMNSVREECYHHYFRPKGYRFSDVKKSIELGIQHNRYVSINYLNCPGFTDTFEEYDALVNFLNHYPIHMIQWRNLNFDPVKYWHAMGLNSVNKGLMGMDKLIQKIKSLFPNLKHGYFNPPKEKWGNKKIKGSSPPCRSFS